jgi:hypothetical protein
MALEHLAEAPLTRQRPALEPRAQRRSQRLHRSACFDVLHHLLRRAQRPSPALRVWRCSPAPPRPASMKPSARSLRVYVAPVVGLRGGARTGICAGAKSSAAAPSERELFSGDPGQLKVEIVLKCSTVPEAPRVRQQSAGRASAERRPPSSGPSAALHAKIFCVRVRQFVVWRHC